MSAINVIWGKTQYYKTKQYDGMWYIAKGFPGGPSVKSGLTEEEADAYLKLLKED